MPRLSVTVEQALQRIMRAARRRHLHAKRIVRIYKRGKPTGHRTKALSIEGKLCSVQVVLNASREVNVRRNTLKSVDASIFYVAPRGHRPHIIIVPPGDMIGAFFRGKRRRGARVRITVDGPRRSGARMNFRDYKNNWSAIA
jgi:hypothetical protein